MFNNNEQVQNMQNSTAIDCSEMAYIVHPTLKKIVLEFIL